MVSINRCDTVFQLMNSNECADNTGSTHISFAVKLSLCVIPISLSGCVVQTCDKSASSQGWVLVSNTFAWFVYSCGCAAQDWTSTITARR